MANRHHYVEAFRCAGGRFYLHRHDACPHCGGALHPVRTSGRATLVSHTTVRVNPSGVPYRLGVAVTRHGASTLCVIDGNVRGNGRERVMLVHRDGRFHAVGAGARVSRSPEPPASRAGSQKS